jgi:nicotinate-nucleotide pyrophosphorylase
MVLEALPIELSPRDLERLVRDALAEDVGAGDVTTEATVDASATCEA